MASRLYKDRKAFIDDLKAFDSELGVHLAAAELKAVVNALGERDETAEICRDRDGNPEPDPELRDTETVPLKESIQDYFSAKSCRMYPTHGLTRAKRRLVMSSH